MGAQPDVAAEVGATEPETLANELHRLGSAFASAKLRLPKGASNAFSISYLSYRGSRTTLDYFGRKLLSLRLSAAHRGMIVDAAVTPTTLKEVGGPICPVSLEPQRFGDKSPGGSSIDRLLNEGTYALGNLCAIVQRVNRGKADKTFDDVLALAQCEEAQDGVSAAEWERLACLMYGAWDALNNAGDPLLFPMATYPGRHMFSARSQVIQLLLLQSLRRDRDERRLEPWFQLTQSAAQPEHLFSNLANGLVAALDEVEYPPSAWLRPGVFPAFVDWYRRCRPAVDTYINAARGKYHRDVHIDQLVEHWAVGCRGEPLA